MSPDTHIRADFPFVKKRLNVLGANIAYVDEGEGPPILFLHGNPTSSYLWRNVLPHVLGAGRCIAPDLVGMGDSDKVGGGYRFVDHARYLSAFIDQLDLKRLILVMHDWGSALGFDWAMSHEARVRGLAFMEAIITPVPSWESFPPAARSLFQALRTPGVGEQLVFDQNVFIEQVLPASVVRRLSPEEMAAYRAPFSEPEARGPMLAFAREVPIAGEPSDVVAVVERYREALRRSPVPKLLFAADRGALVPPALVSWCKSELPRLDVVELGDFLHFVQEDAPDVVGRKLAHWISRQPRSENVT